VGRPVRPRPANTTVVRWGSWASAAKDMGPSEAVAVQQYIQRFSLWYKPVQRTGPGIAYLPSLDVCDATTIAGAAAAA